MKIEVIHPGISTTIQDPGRLNGLAFGVPKCGWMDKELAQFSNILVGNSASNPVLEFTVQGGEYKFEFNTVIAITGECIASVDGIEIQTFEKVQINIDQTLKLRSNGKGRYYYLAIQGKLECDEYYGSYSTYEYGCKGGFKGRKLTKGDVIIYNKTTTHFQKPNLKLNSRKEIRILRAPETSEFSQEDIKNLQLSNFKIGINSNRMGYRLNGVNLKGTKTGNIISSGCIPGTIQVPSSGELIVLMADSPTTGGYPRIAIIHPEDIGLFSQKLPGEKVNFSWYD